MVVDSCHNSGNQGHGVACSHFSNESHSPTDGENLTFYNRGLY